MALQLNKYAQLQYSNWTDPVKGSLDDKQAQRLASKLKTYVNSTKFLREGSTVQGINQDTGVLQKRPLSSVMYYKKGQTQGLDAQDLQTKIRQAILSKNKKKLKDAAAYNYVDVQTGLSPVQQRAVQYNNRAAKLAALALVLGGSGAAIGGLIPYLKYKYNYASDFDDRDSIRAAVLGGIAGISTAYLANSI